MAAMKVQLTSIKPLAKRVPNNIDSLDPNLRVLCSHQFQPCLPNVQGTNLSNHIFDGSSTPCRTYFPLLQSETAR